MHALHFMLGDLENVALLARWVGIGMDRLVRLSLPKPPPSPLVDSGWTLDVVSGEVMWSGERRASNALSDSANSSEATDATADAKPKAAQEGGAEQAKA